MQKLKRFGLGSLAAAGSAALVLGLTSAPAMAAGSFDTTKPQVKISSKITLPKTSSKKVKFTTTITGPAGTHTYRFSDASFAGPKTKLISRNKKIKKSYVEDTFSVYPDDYSSTLAPGTYGFTGNIYSNITTPGKYRVYVPVTQRAAGTYTDLKTQTGTKDVILRANTGYSKSQTTAPSSGYLGRTWNVKVQAPYYQVGAKVSIYAKLKGKKKYKKVSSWKTLKSGNQFRSKATVKLSKKYTKKGTRYYVKVKSAPYASGYNGPVYKIK
ncbi:hypothetical protein ACFPZL_11870 [Leucobacter soli]|uniref:Uncharacterized protein n=1 Tax=Leucobacter soli TaxID=2812850 RepID=A0A916NWJ6_9MICO|nr:hypothetical protein [Leucobacter soli]CAG7617338.1 hypothetical protein LEUCIP111803_02089 [Leucobacter soli]